MLGRLGVTIRLITASFVFQEVQCQEYEPIVCGQSGRERPGHVRYALCLPTSALGFGVQALWMRSGAMAHVAVSGSTVMSTCTRMAVPYSPSKN